MTAEIVGREQELDRLHALLDSRAQGVAALVLEGEPGIGKSTLWLAGLELAREHGFLILSSRPAEAERGLAHLGLADLLEGVLGEVLPELAPPRRRALEAALLLEESPEDPVDRRTLAVAVRDALQLLGRRGDVLVAVDDVQWLDPSSASALAFALRRLDACPVRVLLARRLVEEARPSELEQALEAESVERLAVGPLSVGALHRLLRDRLGSSFARQTLLRIHERSGGNPFFALELARALGADADPSEPLPVPETLDELVRARISGLSAPTRDALALASAVGAPSESLLEEAGVAAGALEQAVTARVIEREDGTIRFTHPLLSSVLYQDLGEKRRSVHARLAEFVEDPAARARHVALSRNTPDSDVAACSTTPRGSRPIAAPRPSRPSSPSRRSG
jgi:AAA ATPase domain